MPCCSPWPVDLRRRSHRSGRRRLRSTVSILAHVDGVSILGGTAENRLHRDAVNCREHIQMPEIAEIRFQFFAYL